MIDIIPAGALLIPELYLKSNILKGGNVVIKKNDGKINSFSLTREKELEITIITNLQEKFTKIRIMYNKYDDYHAVTYVYIPIIISDGNLVAEGTYWQVEIEMKEEDVSVLGYLTLKVDNTSVFITGRFTCGVLSEQKYCLLPPLDLDSCYENFPIEKEIN